MRTLTTRILVRAEVLIPGVVIALVWETLARSITHGAFLFASPSTILEAALLDFRSSGIFRDIGITSTETVMGLILGSTIGTLAGLSLCLSERLSRLSQPYIAVVGAVPIVAMAPVVIQLVGTGLAAKTVLAGFSTLLISLSLAYQGARAAQREWLDFATALRASRGQLLRKIVFPGALTWVLAGARLNVGFALIGAFVGEFVSSDAGLGRYILRYGGIYDIPRVFLGVGLLGLVGLSLSGMVTILSRRWAPPPTGVPNQPVDGTR